MKKYTILLDGGKTLVFTGKFLGASVADSWHCYEDSTRAVYNINSEYIMAVIEEAI